MILVQNDTKNNIPLALFEKIVQELNITQDIELLIVDNETITKLNAQYRNKNYPTDVLSFPLEAVTPQMPLGSIVISIDKAKEQALKYQHSLDDELTLLFIHGLLHLIGYDHENDNGQMRQKEEELIKKFHLPNSLIIRNSKEN